MKVKKLIKKLKKMDPEAQVILQKDPEGNGYSPLRGADPDAIYVKRNAYSGQVLSTKWTADECCLDEDVWEFMKKNRRKCVVLYPEN
jgi:hypothetical protein